MHMNLSKLQETVKDRGAWRAAVHEVAKSDMSYWLNKKWLIESLKEPYQERMESDWVRQCGPVLKELHWELENLCPDQGCVLM